MDITYAQAMAELDDILRQLQADNCDIDRLTTLTARGAELIAFCRSRLQTTQDSLQAALRALQEAPQ